MRFFALVVLAFVASLPARASDAPLSTAVTPAEALSDLDRLFGELKRERNERAAVRIAGRIWAEWRASGSATVDLMMQWADDAMKAQMESVTPLRAIGEPDHIAATVLYLASPAGEYVTGKVLEVDGGLDQPNLDLGLADL